MDRRRKILILHASAGHGHEKAARAIEEVYRTKDDETEVHCLDSLSLTPSFFGNGYKRTYLFLIRYVPWLWGWLYHFTDLDFVYAILAPVRRFTNHFMAHRLKRLLLEEKPDVVITTHFLPTEVAGRLKAKGDYAGSLITAITDYLPHWFWIAAGVDLYVVAHPDSAEALARRGVERSRIQALGIPISPAFSKSHERSALRAKFHLDPERFTALLTSGGAAVGALEKIVRGLLGRELPLEVVVICGTNGKLFARLTSLSSHNPKLHLQGFVHNMDEFMEAADVVVGKGGGLTLSECLAKARPMIAFGPVPGQETRNASFLTRYHAGFVTNDASAVVDKISELCERPEARDLYKEGAQKLARPHAATDLVGIIEGRL